MNNKQWETLVDQVYHINGNAESEAIRLFQEKPPEDYNSNLTVFVNASSIRNSGVFVNLRYYDKNCIGHDKEILVPVSFFIKE